MKVTNKSKKLRVLTVKNGENFETIMVNAGETVEDDRITADVVAPYANVDDFVVEAVGSEKEAAAKKPKK